MRIKIAILVIASWPLASAAARQPAECMAGLRQALIEGRFTGPLVCAGKDATFVLVGQTARSRFSVYDYRYRYFPPNGNVMHGGQKVVIFRRGSYVGQYSLSPPPYTTISVRGDRVILKSQDSAQIVYMDFSRRIPSKIFINGDTHEFFR